jgi:hypothetical protein
MTSRIPQPKPNPPLISNPKSTRLLPLETLHASLNYLGTPQLTKEDLSRLYKGPLPMHYRSLWNMSEEGRHVLSQGKRFPGIFSHSEGLARISWNANADDHPGLKRNLLAHAQLWIKLLLDFLVQRRASNLCNSNLMRRQLHSKMLVHFSQLIQLLYLSHS